MDMNPILPEFLIKSYLATVIHVPIYGARSLRNIEYRAITDDENGQITGGSPPGNPFLHEPYGTGSKPPGQKG